MVAANDMGLGVPRKTGERASDIVLIIEDNPGDAKLVAKMLASLGGISFRARHAARLTEALEALHEAEFCAILLDLSLPDGRGLETVRAVINAAPRTPIVVLSGSSDQELALLAVQAGAQDVLEKGRVDRSGLHQALRYAIERKRAESRLAFLAHHDPLTGLGNRALLMERLEHALSRARRNRDRVAVIFIDLDGFKEINDTLGHDVGDELLVEVGARLRRSVRDCETVARLGGDEFVVVLESIKKMDDAATVARRLLEALRQPFVLDGRPHQLGGSIGVAISPEQGARLEALLEEADRAMYRAKRGGGAAFELHAEAGDVATGDLFDVSCEMERALAEGELELHYQPKRRLVSGALVGVEALLRWNHPRLGVLAPADFIPALERSGMMVRVGEWVLRQACGQLGRWRAEGRALQLAVNLSARQLEQPDLHRSIASILAEHQLPAGLLELEVTEGLLMDNTRRSRAAVEALRREGIRICIDDFGSGYSALGHLQSFPIDVLKLDRSLVAGLGASGRDLAIARAILCLGRDLGIETVAEGVETPEQLEILRALACDHAQGFLICPPLGGAALAAWLDGGA